MLSEAYFMIVVVDYGMGNLGSIGNMLKKIGAEAVISADLGVISNAQKLILPGVGAFDNGMRNLNNRGLREVLDRKVTMDKVPILGICLGMQLLSKSSEEGQLPGLGWIDAQTIRFKFAPSHPDLKIPHMGWNTIDIAKTCVLFEDMFEEPRFYFVHSYHLVTAGEDDVAAWTTHGYRFASAVVRDNIMGVQFHPEKSHKYGIKLFNNFIKK
jgi:imidazole glycerol-phosphate synthase subunit HisH